ncbi:2-hydroxychromene-2-carboxylate isomerase [Pseudomonas pohangensis]|uniref:2-hydroxychromene-2-carboxylate isomerase n=1 Tax=Pseudomonas pohangensis TaxID=364197 RepID=A0A1H2GGQ4_9PSED|nr:DsbA family protein [Pseudomonas pohangensis]SDU18760.1 2-hydroxychromene-2-carboxylate isomerase [Pseudomonas pohangensis]
MKAAIGTAISSVLTSPALRDGRRLLASARRRLSGAAAQVHYFHQADDPYSHLLVQLLPRLLERYRIELQVHLVPAPEDSAAPDRVRLQCWSRSDAAQLAAHAGLDFTDRGGQPLAERQATAEALLAAALEHGRFVHNAPRISEWLWAAQDELPLGLEPLPAAEVARLFEEGAALRKRLGHYLGGTLYFESEWFWGLDRLDYLQERLQQAGLNRGADVSSLAGLPQVRCTLQPRNGQRPQLYFYCSLRSPYTYLAARRIRLLAEHYGADLQLRPVMPMVMRGLPVPLEKRLYIVRDSKRIAEHFGLPFGRIADPVGRPTERGLALLFQALQVGKGSAFAESFLQGVWAEGIDAGSDAGLLKIARRAGLDQAFVDAALADQGWRAQAEANREEMLGLGLWGVPSFRVDQRPAHWGQDRLWLIEEDLIEATGAHS